MAKKKVFKEHYNSGNGKGTKHKTSTKRKRRELRLIKHKYGKTY